MLLKKYYPFYPKISLFAVFLILVFTSTCFMELSESEAKQAVIAGEFGDTILMTRFQGEIVSIAPLPSWLIAWGRLLPFHLDYTVRCISLFPFAILAILSGYMVHQTAGRRATFATIAVGITSFFILLHSMEIKVETGLFCLWVNAGWYTWYIFGRRRHQWLFAWFIAHVFVFLATITKGLPSALFFFYFPLLWLRRPLKIWLRFRQNDHILSLFFLIVVLTGWYFILPHNTLDETVLSLDSGIQQHRYLKHLLFFPFQCLLGFFPWLCFVWPAYCVAFRALEKDPILGKFSRTHTYCLFYFFWFCSTSSPEILLPLIGPLSILIGLNYKTLVRRHGKSLILIPKLFSFLTIYVTPLCIIILILSYIDDELVFSFQVFASALAMYIFAIVLAALTLRFLRRVQIWFAITLATTTCSVIITISCNLYHYVISPYQILPGKLYHNILPQKSIYFLAPEKDSFSLLSYYLRHSLIRIRTIQELPSYEDTIMVLTSEDVLVSKDRVWTPVSDFFLDQDYRFRMWKGEKRSL